MARKDIIMIRQKELKRLHVIHNVLNGEITQDEASEMLLLSERQIRRIVSRIRQEGDISIIHKSRGKESSRKLPKKLTAYIDDATNRIYCRFYEYEGTIPAMDSFMRYIRKHGIPMSIYFDRHTTYKSTAEPTIEEEINGEEPLSEFGRALEELGVERIYAYSPQAKGRIERLFKTLQDRLIKEMRLRGIKSVKEANKFLKTYLLKYNKKFSLKAHKPEDLHMPVPNGIDLNTIFCIKTDRTVRNDNTITYNKELYQIEEVMAGKIVTVTERIDGRMQILYQDRSLKFRQIDIRPEQPQKQQAKIRRRTAYIPPADHPWRKFKMGRNVDGAEKNIMEAAA